MELIIGRSKDSVLASRPPKRGEEAFWERMSYPLHSALLKVTPELTKEYLVGISDGTTARGRIGGDLYLGLDKASDIYKQVEADYERWGKNLEADLKSGKQFGDLNTLADGNGRITKIRSVGGNQTPLTKVMGATLKSSLAKYTKSVHKAVSSKFPEFEIDYIMFTLNMFMGGSQYGPAEAGIWLPTTSKPYVTIKGPWLSDNEDWATNYRKILKSYGILES